MAFGAGALIAAVAYELVAGRVRDGSQAGGDRLRLRRAGVLRRRRGRSIARAASGRKSMTGEAQLAGSASAIVLGTVLDGIPESFVLGASLVEEGVVPVAVVVGVFVSNVPEALSGQRRPARGRAGSGHGSSRCGPSVVAASVVATRRMAGSSIGNVGNRRRRLRHGVRGRCAARDARRHARCRRRSSSAGARRGSSPRSGSRSASALS